MTLRWTSRPVLRRPVLVAAFEGWNDAADAATDAVRWLSRRFRATECGSLDSEQYLDFQAARPQVELIDGVVLHVEWPGTRLLAAPVPEAGRDLLLVLGVEPNLRWPTFCNELLGALRDAGGDTVVTLGALLADVPHSRPVRLTGSATDEVAAARLGLRRSRYQGPTGIVGVLHSMARDAGLSAASLWAPVPHYVATPPNAKASRALLERLASLLDLPLDLTDLDIAADAWERTVGEFVTADSDVARYVGDLEERWDAGVDEDTDTDLVYDDLDDLDEAGEQPGGLIGEEDLPSGETIAADFERYLREQEGD